MELDRFLNLLAASLGALGSVYVLKSYLAMKPSVAAALATARWSFSTPILDSLSAQRAESVVGAIAFLLALALGIVGIVFAPPTLLFASRSVGVLADIAGTGLFLVILSVISRQLRDRHNLAARKVILGHTLDDIVVKKHFESAYLDALAQSAEALLGMKFEPGTQSKDVVKAVAKTLKRNIPQEVLEALNLPHAI